MLPKPLAVAIVCLVTLVWLANFAAQFLVPGYQVDGWVHAIFLSVVGTALGLSRKGGAPEEGGGSVATLIQQVTGGTQTPPPPSPPGPPPSDGALPEDGPRPRSGGAHRALAVLLPLWRVTT